MLFDFLFLCLFFKGRTYDLHYSNFVLKCSIILKCPIYILLCIIIPTEVNAVTDNPGGTRKPDNPPKGIQDTILQDLDNPLKGIWDLLQNRTRSQWSRGLTMPA